MKLDYSRKAKNPTYSIASSVRINGHVTTVKVAEIGKHSDLLKITDNPLEYAQQKVDEYNQSLKNNVVSFTAQIDLNKKLVDNDRITSAQTHKNIGYLFLQNIYKQLKLDQFFLNAVSSKKIDFNSNEINRFLTFARILDPKSKLGTYDDLQNYFEEPDIQYHQILRFMDVLTENYNSYLEHLYRYSNKIVKRDMTVCYYDCTNYYFECEGFDEDIVDEVTGEVIHGLRRFGVSKENRPNPIVQMGLIMDSQGIPITMCIHPGNTSEQVTAVPLEEELIKMTGHSKFIYCADAGLGSYNIRLFNSMSERAFIVTQSIKKLSQPLQEAVFNDYDYRLLSNNRKVKIKDLKEFDRFDESNVSLYNDTAYKILYADKAVELGLYEYKTTKSGKVKKVKATGNLKQRIIVTFSRKMMEYQRAVRARQIERAKRLIEENDPENIKKGPNDVKRFMKRIAKTKSGEEAAINYVLDEEKIRNEEKYDGYYAIATNLDDPAKDILAIAHKRYQIEECFRIMKTNFDARPVYHRKADRIKAHFTICFTALLIYRLMEVQLDQNKKHHTIDETRDTLRNMNVTEEFNAYYKALYTGSQTLSDLVSVFGLPLDHEFYQSRQLRSLIKKIQ